MPRLEDREKVISIPEVIAGMVRKYCTTMDAWRIADITICYRNLRIEQRAEVVKAIRALHRQAKADKNIILIGGIKEVVLCFGRIDRDSDDRKARDEALKRAEGIINSYEDLDDQPPRLREAIDALRALVEAQ